MPPLFKSFDAVSKREWLDKVNKDLKGKSIDSLNSRLESGPPITPFYHSDDIPGEISIPVSERAHPALGWEIKVGAEPRDNEIILEGLEGGINYLTLDVSDKTEVDFATLLRGVMINMMELRLIGLNGHTLREHWGQYIADQYEDDAVDGRITIIGKAAVSHPFKRGVMINAEGSDEVLMTLLCDGLRHLIDANKGVTTMLAIPFGHHYIDNICQVRAVRLLWANLCEALGKDTTDHPLVIEGVVSSSDLSTDANDNKIALSQIAVSMLTAGVDIMRLPNSDVTSTQGGDPFSRRISRNLYHLGTMEGHMDKVKDPAAGSYLFERLTVDLAGSAWNRFIKETKDA